MFTCTPQTQRAPVTRNPPNPSPRNTDDGLKPNNNKCHNPRRSKVETPPTPIKAASPPTPIT